MCGIIGYTGLEDCVDIILDGLKRLEYRGYDSAGIAVIGIDKKLKVVKKVGSPDVLCDAVYSSSGFMGLCGIGHTRWATHGKPSDINSHPHISGQIAVVHNGIIENYAELKAELIAGGVKFLSETDTEVVAHLISKYYSGDMLDALKKTTQVITGSYALAVLCESEPKTIYVAKKDSPLIAGKGKTGCFVASDIPALVSYCNKIFIIDDFEFAKITPTDIYFYDSNLNLKSKDAQNIDITQDELKISYGDSFMYKEIKEIPKAVRDTYKYYQFLEIEKIAKQVFDGIENITIIACGTAYHAGLVAKYLLEERAGIKVRIDIASEFRYKRALIDQKTLVIAISQSGETADTIAALKHAARQKARTIAITNVRTSSITNFVDLVFPTIAGPEIGVAATKSYCTQLIVLYYICFLAEYYIKGKDFDVNIIPYLEKIADKCWEIINNSQGISKLANELFLLDKIFFIGRGLDYAVSLEAALKLKEITYISSEGLAAGELKHGTLALIEDGTPVFVLLTQQALAEKTMNALHEVKARGAYVIAVTQLDLSPNENIDKVIKLPAMDDMFMPVCSVIPLQLFAYYVAVLKGYNPDKPRNLAKSVTVE